jgi:glycosyltransferase involved in cell wall biosynthesis
VLATTHRADVLDVPARGRRSRDQVAEAVASIDQITAVSAAIAAAAEQLATPRRPVEVVPNGADTTVFMPRDRSEARLRLGLRDDGPLITFVGKLVPRKGVDTLIEAMGLLAARPAGAPRLAMVGIGELRPSLEARARELGIASRIHWAGKVPHDEVAWWMAAGDVFVLPSLSEGLPTVICEVMSCARPAVATAVDGTPEIVRDGETGLLVPPRDPGSLALALGRLVDDPELARRMGDRALEIGRETYTWHANAVRTAELYRRIAE